MHTDTEATEGQGRLNAFMGQEATHTGTSVFDPVLCELAYRWFCPAGGTVLDPFAGGSVRGIVASRLGLQYVGIELSERQVEANRVQAQSICGDPQPVWHVGDAGDIDQMAPDLAADFVFSCPPYADLEQYTDDPRDLSNMPYGQFLEGYRDIIAKAVARLREDRFAVFVVGDVRDRQGIYRGFPWHTVEAFQQAGAGLYNEAVLITPPGSLPVRAGNHFQKGRKLGKTHQNVLGFVKGDPKRATDAVGHVDFGATDEGDEGDEGEGQAGDESDEPPPGMVVTDPDALTPTELTADGRWLKRDDLFQVAGVPGGKARTCWALAQGAPGLVTAGSRASPQVNIVAHVGQALGVPVRAHTPQGALSPEVEAAQHAGAEVVQHRAGYNSVIVKRARDDASANGLREIPFGMDHPEAVKQTRRQVFNLPSECERVVVAVGSGMTLAGILWGLHDQGRDLLPVLGLQVGADPTKRLQRYAPGDWRDCVALVQAGVDYHKAVEATVGGVILDAHDEAKAVPFLQVGDCLWLVGIRQTARA